MPNYKNRDTKIYKRDRDNPVTPYENALLGYVYGRVTLNLEDSIFLLPASFHYLHHAIEVSIKTLLGLKKIGYSYGMKGHETCYLLEIACSSKRFSTEVCILLENNDRLLLLKVLDESYVDIKYEAIA